MAQVSLKLTRRADNGTPPLPPGFVLDKQEEAPSLPKRDILNRVQEKAPPLPKGFVLDKQETPPLPEGFVLDDPQDIPPPPGFILDEGKETFPPAQTTQSEERIPSFRQAPEPSVSESIYSGIKDVLTGKLPGDPARIRPEDIASAQIALEAREKGIPKEEHISQVSPKGTKLKRVERFLTGIGRGALGTVEGMAGAVEWLTEGEMGKDLANEAKLWQKELTPEDTDFSDVLAGGIGSVATFFIPGMGVAKGTGALAKITPKLASWFGAGAGTILEATTEAGQVYRDVLSDKKNVKEAEKAATKTFWINVPLLLITNKMGVFSEKGGRLKKALVSAPLEGSQEAGQAIISSKAQGKPVNLKEVLTSGAVGFLTGGGIGGITGGVPSSVEQRAVQEGQAVSPEDTGPYPIIPTPGTVPGGPITGAEQITGVPGQITEQPIEPIDKAELPTETLEPVEEAKDVIGEIEKKVVTPSEVPHEIKKPEEIKSEVPIETLDSLRQEEPIITGIKLKETTRVRKERGLEPIPDPKVRANQESLGMAKDRIKSDPTYVTRLVEELAGKPRPITADEVSALDIHYITLQQDIRQARRVAEIAHDKGTGDTLNEAKRKHDYLESKIAEFEQMYRDTGTETARGLQMRDRLINENYTLEALESRARAAKGFEPLTSAERTEIKILHEKIKKVEDTLSEKEISIQQLQAETAINKIKKDVSERYHPGILKRADLIVKSMEKSAKSASKRLKGKLSRLSAGVDPTIIADGAIVGSAKLARGTLNFAGWSAEMVKDFGIKIKPYLNKIWAKSNLILGEKLKKTSPKVGKLIKSLSTTERIADSKEKIKTIMGKSEQEDITFPVRQMVRAFVEENPKINRDELISKVHSTLKEIVPAITMLNTMDAISGRGAFQTLAQDEISKTIRDLKTQIRLIAHQIDIEAKRPLPRTGLQRDKMSAIARRELQRLNELKRKFGVVVTSPEAQLASVLQSRKRYYQNRISDLGQEIKTKERTVKTKTPSPEDTELINLKKEYAELREEHLEIFGKRKITDKQRLSMALKAAEKTEQRWGDRLQEAKKGIFDKKIPKRKITSAELSVIKARTEAIREEVKELKNAAFPKKSRIEIALQSTKTRTVNRIAELEAKIAANDFSKRPKRKSLEDPALIKLRADLAIVKDKYKAREEKFKWEQMGAFQKFKKITANTYDAARLLMTTGEFSFILRQGKFFALSRPLTTARTIPQTLRSFGSERNAKASELEITEHPMYAKSQAAKLHISKEGDTLNKQEELIMGKWSNLIPVVRNFNRAATTFLNKLRYDSWLAMRKTMSKGGESTIEEDKMYARLANEATGRGRLGALEPAAVALGRVFFSPRYMASRIQLALGHAMWGGTARSRSVIAREYAKALIGMAIYYNLLYFGAKALKGEEEKEPKITFDPRTSDFGKIIIGNTRLDPLAGMAQLATFGGRTVTGESKSTKGKVYKIRGKVPYGKPTWWEVAGRFAAYKGHPVPVTVANLFSGVDLIGNEATIMSEAGKLSSPITYKDIYEAMELEGVPLKVAVSLLTFLGEGLQTYKPKDSKKRRRKSIKIGDQ